MPRAVAVGLPERALQISASPLGKVASVDSLGTATITASA
jgi:hypothetical protein